MSRVVIERAALVNIIARLDAAVQRIEKGHHKAAARYVAQIATDLSNLPDAPEASE